MNSKTVVPYWFKDEDGKSLTVNHENYFNNMCKFCSFLNRCRGITINQQYCTTPHTANATLELLKQKFGDRVISQRTNFSLAAHSSYLNSLDFFLRGYAKDYMYTDKVRTLQKEKSAITRFIERIPADM